MSRKEAVKSLTKEEAPKEKPETIHELFRRGLGEYVGHTMFVWVACGAATTTARFISPGAVQIGISLCFGFTLTALAFTFGHISGGHLNPAVTIGIFSIRKLPWKRCVIYLLAQFLAGLSAAALLKGLIPSTFKDMTSEYHCFGANTVNQDVSVTQAFFLEMILTAFLLLVVNAASDSAKTNNTLVPLVIGFCVTGCHMLAIPLTGTSLNPTRSLASAVAASNLPNCEHVWSNHWLFWVAPICGGIAGSWLYELVFLVDASGHNTLESMYRKTTGTLHMITAKEPEPTRRNGTTEEEEEEEEEDEDQPPPQRK